MGDSVMAECCPRVWPMLWTTDQQFPPTTECLAGKAQGVSGKLPLTVFFLLHWRTKFYFLHSPLGYAGLEVRRAVLHQEDTTMVPLNWKWNWWCGNLGLLLTLEKTGKKGLYQVGWDDWFLTWRARGLLLYNEWGKRVFLDLNNLLDAS